MQWFRSRCRSGGLTISDCENDAKLLNDIQSTQRAGAEALKLRFQYLDIVPWSFCKADTREGAANFLRGATSRPSSEQDPLTNYLHDTHRDALLLCADTGEARQSLVEEVAALNESPLDESAGEGYHRDTHLTRIRAVASKSPFIKQSTRTKFNIRLLKRFIRMGEGGKLVVRFEWRNWKRVLQVADRKLWRNVKGIKKDDAFLRVYRMDEMATVDWSTAAPPVRAPGQGSASTPVAGAHVDEGEMPGLRAEYLQCVLKPRQWYSITVPRATLGVDGEPAEITEPKYFQVVAKTYAKSKPKLMPTIESHRHKISSSKLALCLQEVTVRRGDGTGVEGSDSVVVFEDIDAQWQSWEELGDFPYVRTSLTRFQTAAGSPEHEACIVLSEAVPVVPEFALTDERCPSLLMILELRRLGWRPIAASVVHTEVAVGDMDNRQARAMKHYYLVLLDLRNCLSRSSSIPSNEPTAFYKCLLKGFTIEPGLGNAHYVAALKDKDTPCDVPVVGPPLEDEEILTSFIVLHTTVPG